VPDGILVVDKPGGMTSHDVVDVVRKRLGTKKVGHGGTLDPDATGVLIVGVGRATRLLSYAQSAPKRYTARARFGISTTTQDASGEIVSLTEDVVLDRLSVERALASFVGEIEQTPPMVSAVKVGGERLYRKARRGESVDRAPRRVTVYDARVTGFEVEEKWPEATIDIRCSSGTYIRTIVHDWGAVLGCGAHLRALRRTESGGHTLSNAVALDEIDAGALRPVAETVKGLAGIEVDGRGARLVHNGRPLNDLDLTGLEEGRPVALMREGQLLAVYRRVGDRLVADRVLSTEVAS
jgi:tRNA pseudouridine55 synthase